MPETSPTPARQRARPFVLPVRKRHTQTICSYRRGRQHLTCVLVTLRSVPDGCRQMEELRKLVLANMPSASLEAAA